MSRKIRMDYVYSKHSFVIGFQCPLKKKKKVNMERRDTNISVLTLRNFSFFYQKLLFLNVN